MYIYIYIYMYIYIYTYIVCVKGNAVLILNCFTRKAFLFYNFVS